MASPNVLPFYDYLGQIEYLSGYPESLGDWSPSTGELLSAEQQCMIDTVAHVLRKSPTESRVRAEDLNLVSKFVYSMIQTYISYPKDTGSWF